MIEEIPELKNLTDKINSVSKSVRNSCKISTALRNEAALDNPKLWNFRAKGKSVTRAWLGHAITVNRHLQLQKYYATLMDAKVGNITEHRETVEHSFIEKTMTHNKHLQQIKKCSDMLQKEKLPLWKCQNYLDFLMKSVARGNGRTGSMFAKCTLGTHYIVPNNNLSTNPPSETGVAKIQQGVVNEEMMNLQEVIACMPLLKDNDDENGYDSVSENEDEYDFAKAVTAGEKRKEREVAGTSKYIDCSFIMGTAACVERLWSEGDALMTKRRKGMSPITTEMILFLKKNRDLWEKRDVVEADKRRVAADKESRTELA